METLPQLLEAIENMSGSAKDIVNWLRDTLYPLYIRVSWERTEFPLRVILNVHNKARWTPLARECGGLILEISEEPKARVICWPPREFAFSYSLRKLRENIDRYEVYPVCDGTVLSLYYTDRWCIATKQGIDVTEKVWRGYTFGAALRDVLSLYPGFDWAKLDETCTYTIGIKHPAFHPFQQPAIWDPHLSVRWVIYAWFICETRADGTRVTNKDIGLPIVPRIMDPGKLDLELKGQTKSYIENRGIPQLGFILRDWSGKTRISDVLITSDLMRDIRDLVYQPGSADPERFRDMNYVVVHAYLSPEKSTLFESLFPQYAPLFEQYDQVVANTCDNIYAALLDNSVELTPDVKELYRQVRKQYRVCSKKRDVEIKNITAIILHTDNIDIFMRLFA